MVRHTARLFLTCLTALALFTGSGVASSAPGAPMVKKEAFGSTPDGKSVELYTLADPHGMEVRVMTYGVIIVSV